MATLAPMGGTPARVEGFFPVTAILMGLVLVGGFSLDLVAGRATFAGSPPLLHAHALVFFGWTVLYILQTMLASSGSLRLHRTLGWLALGWIPAIVLLGLVITTLVTRRGDTPFFFTPLYFLLMDSLAVLTFGGLAGAAIILRRHTDWHRRLMFCAMAILTGPGFGRLLPMPFLIPYAGDAPFAALMLFPLAGVTRDLLRDRRVHPAWIAGIAALVTSHVAMHAITASPPGLALYRAVTAGSPGAAIAPRDYPPLPPGFSHAK